MTRGEMTRGTAAGLVGLARVMLAAVAAVVALGVAFGLLGALPTEAQAQPVADRITQVTEEEQAELLARATIGSNTGGLPAMYAKDDYPEATVLEYPDIPDAVTALDAGRLEYAVVPEPMALLYMRKHSQYTYLSAGMYQVTCCYSLAKGNEALCEELSAAIRKLTDDGTIASIMKKWTVEGNYTMEGVPVREDGETLVVACSASDEPLAFIQNGELVGADIEIMMRVAYELGYRVEFREMTFTAELSSVVTGRVDVGLACAPTEERKQTLCFTEPVYHVRWVAMTTTSNPSIQPYLTSADDESEGEGGLLDGIVATYEDLRGRFIVTFVDENRWQLVLKGVGVTMAISAGGFALGTLGGALLCRMARSRSRAAQVFSAAYVRIVTGIPVLVWLMLLYYVVFVGDTVPSTVVAVLCFGLQFAAPLCGVFRTGLGSVDKGQVEACLALGFSRFEAFRRVALPQAANAAIGLYSGQLTALIKGTAVVGYVAITDLTKVSDIIRARTFDAFFPLVSTALVYFAVILICGWVFGRIARRIDPKRRDKSQVLRGVKERVEDEG